MTHWQNFYHDASAEELDDYLVMFQNHMARCPWLKNESRRDQLCFLPMPRRSPRTFFRPLRRSEDREPLSVVSKI